MRMRLSFTLLAPWLCFSSAVTYGEYPFPHKFEAGKSVTKIPF
jgi:hypothetical protein